MKIILDIIKKYLLIITGFIFFITYIYLTFIRERLPRDIPFELNEFKFYILCIICLGYIYIIYKTLKPKEPNNFFVKSLNLLSKPLIYFITFVKNIKYVSKKYISIWFNLAEFLECWSWADNILFIYLLQIFPRIILLLIFIIDVFYVRKIEIFYYFILLGFLPLMYMLFIKYLENMLEKCIQFLEQMYDQVAIFDANINDINYDYNPKAIYHDKIVPLRKYIEIQFENFIKNDESIEYEGSSLSTQEHYDEYKNKYNKTTEELTRDDYKILNQEFDDLIPKLLTIKIFLDYSTKEGQKTAYIPQIKLFILCMYLICWIYVLIISIPTLNDLSITIKICEILTQYSNIPNPFSECTMLSFGLLCSKNKSNNFEKIFNLIIFFTLLITGLICTSWVIWARFIRKRTIRDIPDCYFTEYRFWILLYICCIYLYVIKNLLQPPKTSINMKIFVEILYKPLITLDHTIKYNKYLKPYYYIYIFKSIAYLDPLGNSVSMFKLKVLIYTVQILPRFLLVMFLLLDTFYFKKLEIFYKVVLIGLLPFFYNYLNYSLKDIYEKWIQELEKNYQSVYIFEKGFEYDKEHKKIQKQSIILQKKL